MVRARLQMEVPSYKCKIYKVKDPLAHQQSCKYECVGIVLKDIRDSMAGLPLVVTLA